MLIITQHAHLGTTPKNITKYICWADWLIRGPSLPKNIAIEVCSTHDARNSIQTKTCTYVHLQTTAKYCFILYIFKIKLYILQVTWRSSRYQKGRFTLKSGKWPCQRTTLVSVCIYLLERFLHKGILGTKW